MPAHKINPAAPPTIVPPPLMKSALKIFEQVKWDMGAIPCQFEIKDNEATAHWDRGLIVIDTRHAITGGLDFVRDVLYHEFGHALIPWSAPAQFKHLVADHKMLNALLTDKKAKWPKDRNAYFLNIVWDTIIDILRTWECNCNPLVSLECQEKMHPNDLSGYTPGSNMIMEWLRAFREAVTKTPYSPHICEQIQDTADTVLQILRRNWDQRDRVKQVSELLFPLFTEDFENEQKDIEEMLKKLGVHSSGTVECGDIDEMLEGLDLDDKETREIIEKEIGKGLGGKSLSIPFEKLWREAAHKVRFQMEFKQKAPGEQMRAGDLPWMPGMPLRKLDIERTMERFGKFIPGRTTVQPHVVDGPGTYVDAPQPLRMAVCCDVSGSMSKDPTSMALMTFVHEARRRQKPVAVDMFADSHYYIDFTMNYRKVGEEAYTNYRKAGGGNTVPGCEKIASKLRAGDLLLYITDFGLDGDDQRVAIKTMQNLKAQGVSVVFILMFDKHYIGNCSLPYVFCKNIEDLANITLTAI